MKRIITGLAASAAIFTLSAGAFAAAKLDTPHGGATQQKAVMMAQASGGPAATEPSEQLIGAKRKTETDVPAPAMNPGAPDMADKADSVDASQSKRKDTAEPPQSGAK